MVHRTYFQLVFVFLILVLFFYLFVLKERETERENKWGRGGEEQRQSRKASILSTEPDVGLRLTDCDIMTSAEIMSWTLN